ncbi:MAG: DUF6194 family protein [Planctomycetaceae bacterium]|nr:DUF6194 family protein [Planctomycetaceae bacterium]
MTAKTLTPANITHYIEETFTGIDVVRPEETGGPEIAWGDLFFIYDPQRNLSVPQRFPFATIVTKDYGDFDCASNLNRPEVYRFNIGLRKATFQKLFPDDGCVFDYAAFDVLMPHPVYATQSWACIVNPTEATFQTLHPLLMEAYQFAVSRITKAES